MSNGDNKGMQFVITTMIFILLFLLFYYFFFKKDDEGEISAEDFEIALINDGVLFLSDIKGENRVNRVHGSFVVWAPLGESLYYIDNYSKLKHYDLESKKSEDVAVNVSSFEVSPDGDSVAFVEDTDDPKIKIIGSTDGELISEIPSGRSPRWFKDGEALIYIKDGDIYTTDRDGYGTKKLFTADAVDLDVSPDGKFILFTEQREGGSRLVLGDIGRGSKKIVKEVSTTEEATEASPLGFSLPRFLSQTNEALFAYNDGKGGKIFKMNADDGSIGGVCMEGGPIFSLSISPDDDRITYFYMSRANLPSFKEKVGEGEEREMLFAPSDLKAELNKALLDMQDKGILTGDKVNKNTVTRVLDSDRIKIVDLKKGLIWFAGSGQYPSLR